MNLSKCIAAALLVASTSTGCSSCAKDDAPPGSQAAPSEGPSTAPTDRKAEPLPRGFGRRNTPGIESTVPAASAVVDAGSDATTH